MVVQWLNSMGEPYNPLDALIQECKGWLRKGWVVNIQHGYREGNSIANSMAKQILHLQQGVFRRWRTPPEDLKEILHQDAMGLMAHSRVV